MCLSILISSGMSTSTCYKLRSALFNYSIIARIFLILYISLQCCDYLLSAEITPSSAIDNTIVIQAISGNETAVQQLQTYSLLLSTEQARNILEQIQSSSHIRNSALAVRFTDHPDPWIREYALITIGRLRVNSSAILDVLVQKLNDDVPIVRHAAGEALVRIHDARALPGLIDLLDLKDSERVQYIHEVLCQTSRQSFPIDSSTWRQWIDTKDKDEQLRFNDCLRALSKPQPDTLSIINQLANLELQRDQATRIFMSLATHSDQKIAAAAQNYLYRWTGASFGLSPSGFPLQPGTYTPAPLPVAPPLEPTAEATAKVVSVPVQGFFDTLPGLITVIGLALCTLGGLVWLLRLFPGLSEEEKIGTGYITQRIGRTTVRVIADDAPRQRPPNTKPSTRATVLVPRTVTKDPTNTSRVKAADPAARPAPTSILSQMAAKSTTPSTTKTIAQNPPTTSTTTSKSTGALVRKNPPSA